jgi:hypothetical protein
VTLPQLLHLKNSEELHQRITKEGARLDSLLKRAPDGEVIRALFLSTVNRPPTSAETGAVEAQLAGAERKAVFGDLLWALLNSKEFAFNH